MAIDWQRVAAWREFLLRDEMAALASAVADFGLPQASFAWDPPASAISGPQNRFLLDYWRMHASGGPPPVAIADPSRMRPALGYIAIVEPVDDGRDMLYRLYGSMLVSIAGMDLTRKRLSLTASTVGVVEAPLAVYQAVIRRPQPLLWQVRPPRAEYAARWERLVLPLVGADGTVSRLISGQVPFDSRGVLIVA